MDQERLKQIFRLTALRSVGKQYKYHRLDRNRLGEAEVRNVMARILEENKIYYGIEISTKAKQPKKENIRNRVALVDLVIYENRKDETPSIFIEFKRGQPSLDDIKKDFRKMVREPEKTSLRGGAFFHILPKVEDPKEKFLERARKEIIKKYAKTYIRLKKGKLRSRWFVLFILDASSRKYYYCSKSDINRIDKLDDGAWYPLKKPICCTTGLPERVV